MLNSYQKHLRYDIISNLYNNNISQNQVAKLLGISGPLINKYINQRTSNVLKMLIGLSIRYLRSKNSRKYNSALKTIRSLNGKVASLKCKLSGVHKIGNSVLKNLV